MVSQDYELPQRDYLMTQGEIYNKIPTIPATSEYVEKQYKLKVN
jgi:hypothetical protein